MSTAISKPRFPHTRGGEPFTWLRLPSGAWCFPHTRGGEPRLNLVGNSLQDRFPHTRGGEPGRDAEFRWSPLSFPHTRGGEPRGLRSMGVFLSVFPTHVGVNRIDIFMENPCKMFSPHTWG